MEKLYLASPYGFTDAGIFFMQRKMIPAIQEASYQVLSPWEYSGELRKKINAIEKISDVMKQIEVWKSLNKEIGRNNQNLIKLSKVVVAVLEGTDVDSGVAAEIGYAFALKKKIIGYRSDKRITGDNVGARVNLQIEYFISESGGQIATSIHELKGVLGSA
jgi:nucleoside 2-deoxyribosyltransferase